MASRLQTTFGRHLMASTTTSTFHQHQTIQRLAPIGAVRHMPRYRPRKVIPKKRLTDMDIPMDIWLEYKKEKPRRITVKRVGVLGVKCGMVPMWDKWGVRHALTVVMIPDCQVTQQRTMEVDGYWGLQVGAGAAKSKHITKPLKGQFDALDVPYKKKLVEFKVDEENMLPVGTPLNVSHFPAGSYVDVQGVTNGKGFAGAMKRWGFAGQPASHGNTKAHRKPGSSGAGQTPGKVWKGKKMPGRMGGKARSVMSMRIYRVDPVNNLIFLKGSVPGRNGNFVRIQDARLAKLTLAEKEKIPYPTYFPEKEGDYPRPLIMQAAEVDPLKDPEQ